MLPPEALKARPLKPRASPWDAQGNALGSPRPIQSGALKARPITAPGNALGSTRPIQSGALKARPNRFQGQQ
jgi:hypothetical protein